MEGYNTINDSRVYLSYDDSNRLYSEIIINLNGIKNESIFEYKNNIVIETGYAIKEEYEYDNNNNLIRKTNDIGIGSLDTETYTYNDNGQISSRIEEINGKKSCLIITYTIEAEN